MAPAIAHFLVGAALLLLLVAPFFVRYELDRNWALWLVPIGGLWGLAPDVHHIAPVFRAELYAIHNSPWTDLFAFHYTLDRPTVRGMYLESVFGSILVFLLAVGVFSVTHPIRERRLFEGRSRWVVITIAAGYAGGIASVPLIHAGLFGQAAALIGRSSPFAGVAVVGTCSFLGGACFAVLLERLVPRDYLHHPAVGAVVGVPLGIAGWLVSGLAVPLWIRGGTELLLFEPALLGAGLCFGVVFGTLYATLRGAIAPHD